LASFDAAMRETLLDCCALDWSAIPPAIFGALFQSIMDEKARRNLGAHCTSEENIQTEEFGNYFARIPLTNTPHIHFGPQSGNALRVDWNALLPAERCSYVLGNPPFVGKQHQTDAQKADLSGVTRGVAGAGVLDLVSGWYFKAAAYIRNTAIRCALVSTNSVTQGEQVGVMWGWLLAHGIKIHFAHRTFRWSNEGRGVAAVHCVIIGFGAFDAKRKSIYEYDDVAGQPHAVAAGNINPYLVDASDLVLQARRRPICRVSEIRFGSMPNDGGSLLLSDDEKRALIAAEPMAVNWIRPFLSADEFINRTNRWCLWLVECPPDVLKAMPLVAARVAAVRTHRLKSERATTKSLAATPTLFGENRQPLASFAAIPKTSSERRQFVPIGLLSDEVIASTELFTIAGAGGFEFGVLVSTMHNAWVRYTCGRLKSDFRYSAGIVYNNFPWPENPTDVQKRRIEAAAQAVLDAPAAHPNASLADLYDPLTMPPNLVKAHQALDGAVDAAYGRKGFRNDAERVAFLFELYQKYTSLLPAAVPARKGRKRTGAAAV